MIVFIFQTFLSFCYADFELALLDCIVVRSNKTVNVSHV